MGDLYPLRALERCRNGQVEIACQVRADGRIDCAVTRERPRGWGFGDASLRAARRFYVTPPIDVVGRPIGGAEFAAHFYWETDRNVSDRVDACTPSIDGPTAQCVIRMPCRRSS